MSCVQLFFHSHALFFYSLSFASLCRFNGHIPCQERVLPAFWYVPRLPDFYQHHLSIRKLTRSGADDITTPPDSRWVACYVTEINDCHVNLLIWSFEGHLICFFSKSCLLLGIWCFCFSSGYYRNNFACIQLAWQAAFTWFLNKKDGKDLSLNIYSYLISFATLLVEFQDIF